jgi:tripartite-type tricarboxylate transporter receptor subunit TctC
MPNRRTLLAASLGVASLGLAAPFIIGRNASAQGFPSRPVVLIVPYAPGGSMDVLMRAMAPELEKVLGQSVVVELRPGAGGNIGAAQVAQQSRPDGHTILAASISLSTNVSLMNLDWDPRQDLTPVAGIAALPHLVVVSADSPYRSLQDLLAGAKARPGELTYGSSGPGTGSHLAGFALAERAGVQMTHVPYRGSGAVYPDLIAQRVTMLLDVMASSLGQVQSGAVRAIGITSAKRSSILPEVPTVAEQGVPGYAFDTWFGFFARKGTPPETVSILSEATRKVLQVPSVQERLRQNAAELLPPEPAAFGRYFEAEVERWARLVREGKLERLN